MSTTTVKIKRPRRVPATAIRPDYQQQEWWTIGEAADYTGKCEAAINAWIREGKFTARSNFTVYRIYGPEFIRFIDTGEPQIPTPVSNPTS